MLERARELYMLGISTEEWGELLPRVRPFVAHVIVEIEKAAASATVGG